MEDEPRSSSTHLTALHFVCAPGVGQMEEAHLSAVEQPELAAHPEDEDCDVLSDAGEEDREAVENSELSPELKKRLLTAYSQFVFKEESPPPCPAPVALPPVPPPPRGRGRPPKNPQPPPAPVDLLLQGATPEQKSQRSPPPAMQLDAAPSFGTATPLVIANGPGSLARPRPFPPNLSVPPPLPPCPWFAPTGITAEEVEELGVCFPNLKASDPVDAEDLVAVAYLQLRNTLIDAYRQNINQKLLLDDCRHYCDGDLSVLVRMFSFLERNRLINYALTPATGVAGAGQPMDSVTRKLKDELRDHWKRTPTCTACDRICLYSFYILSPAMYGSVLPLSHLQPAVWCADCAREAPHNQCLMKVSLPSLHAGSAAASWSEQQLNALFDAIEEHAPDWLAVSRTVSKVPGNPTRSPSECLAVFLSMPLAENPNLTPSTTNDSAPSLHPTPQMSAKPPEHASQESDPSKELIAMEILSLALDSLLKRRGEHAEDEQLHDMHRHVGSRLNHLTRQIAEQDHHPEYLPHDGEEATMMSDVAERASGCATSPSNVGVDSMLNTSRTSEAAAAVCLQPTQSFAP